MSPSRSKADLAGLSAVSAPAPNADVYPLRFEARSCLAGRPEKRQSPRQSGRCLWIPASDSLDLRCRRLFPPLHFQGDDMATLTRSQKLLASAGAGALGGAAALVLLAGNIVTVEGAGATAADASASLVEPDFPICHAPAATAMPNLLLR